MVPLPVPAATHSCPPAAESLKWHQYCQKLLKLQLSRFNGKPQTFSFQKNSFQYQSKLGKDYKMPKHNLYKSFVLLCIKSNRLRPTYILRPGGALSWINTLIPAGRSPPLGERRKQHLSAPWISLCCIYFPVCSRGCIGDMYTH